MAHGGDRKSNQLANFLLESRDDPDQQDTGAAELLNVSEPCVRTAKRVQRQGSLALVETVPKKP